MQASDIRGSDEARIRELEATVRRLDARDAVTQILADAPSISSAVPRILQSIGELFGWQAAAFWIPEQNGALRCSSMWAPSAPRLQAASETRTFPVGL